eukprot:3621471-Rhodomonas_salina.1
MHFLPFTGWWTFYTYSPLLCRNSYWIWAKIKFGGTPCKTLESLHCRLRSQGRYPKPAPRIPAEAKNGNSSTSTQTKRPNVNNLNTLYQHP